MRTTAALALLALVTSATASADELFGQRTAARAAALYVEVPLGATRHRTKPAFGLRLQELPLPHSTGAARQGSGFRTLLDVPLVVREDDPVRGSGAAMLLGKGAIVGIVVGAVVAVAVISDDGDGGGY